MLALFACGTGWVSALDLQVTVNLASRTATGIVFLELHHVCMHAGENVSDRFFFGVLDTPLRSLLVLMFENLLAWVPVVRFRVLRFPDGWDGRQGWGLVLGLMMRGAVSEDGSPTVS